MTQLQLEMKTVQNNTGKPVTITSTLSANYSSITIHPGTSMDIPAQMFSDAVGYGLTPVVEVPAAALDVAPRARRAENKPAQDSAE